MPDFKVISDNLAELYPTLYQNIGLEKDKDALERDLSRTRYFAENQTKKDIKERLKREFFGDGKENTYLQGGIDGGMLKLLTSEHYYNLPNQEKEVVDQIRVCYVNDHDVLCGFSIQIFQDLKSQSPTTFHYALSVYQGVTNFPEQRKYTHIVDPILLNKDLNAQNLPANEILNLLKEKLQSTVLYEAIAPIITSQHFASKAAFDELNDNLRINENGYDQIQELNQYRQQLNTIRHSEKDNALNQSFLKRHDENFLLITASVILGIGAILALVLFAAPLAATIAGALIIASAAVSTLITAVKCWRDEKSLNTYKAERDHQLSNAKTQFDKKIEDIRTKLESPEPTPPNSSNGQIFSSPIDTGINQAKERNDVHDEDLTQPRDPKTR